MSNNYRCTSCYTVENSTLETNFETMQYFAINGRYINIIVRTNRMKIYIKYNNNKKYAANNGRKNACYDIGTYAISI